MLAAPLAVPAWRRWRRRVCSAQPRDVRTQCVELRLHRLVAAIEVVDPVDDRLALGDQAGEHEAGRGAQVGRHDGRSRERGPAVHACVAAVEPDVGAHARQLGGMLEAVLEDGFADRRQPFGLGRERHALRLEVGREAGEGGGHDIARPQRALATRR